MRKLTITVLCLSFAIPLAMVLASPQHGRGALNDLKFFRADGVGVTTLCAGNICNTSGTAKGEPFGTAKYETTTNFDVTSAGPNSTPPTTGLCFTRASGTITLTTPSGDTITMVQATNYCNPSADTTSTVQNGVYLITGGTGRFVGVSGTGNVAIGIAGGPAYLHIDGNINFP